LHCQRSTQNRRLFNGTRLQVYGVDVDEYYESQSSIRAMPDVAIPMLCLNARDDPLIDPSLVNSGINAAKANPNVITVLTSHGGHLGWVHGWRKQWMCPAIADFMLATNAVLDEKERQNGTAVASGAALQSESSEQSAAEADAAAACRAAAPAAPAAAATTATH
jgi:hypothetical protein